MNDFWDFRVIRKDLPTEDGVQGWYSVQEVYYDDDGQPTAQTTDLEVTGKSVDALRLMLKKMLNCLDNPILEEIYKDDRFK
tara:strand:+ start:403 stop:645 length:243 start_codon:yes stop_codon:yes gene_type:complete